MSLSVTPHLTVALFTQNCATQAAILHDGIVKYFKYCPTVNLRITTFGTMQQNVYRKHKSGSEHLSGLQVTAELVRTEVLVSCIFQD